MAWTKAGRNIFQSTTTQTAANWPWGINPAKIVSISATATNATNSSTITTGGQSITALDKALAAVGDSARLDLGTPGVWYEPIVISAIVAQTIQFIVN